MDDENRSFSWTRLFIKIIIVIIFILFTIWLLSLSNKGTSGSLDVLKDEIFAENIEKMKKAGKDYFSKDKIPSKIGGIEKLTLKEMYEKKLLVELQDKNGDACHEENSYVSMEKFDKEYQMKVYLECGEEKDYIIVTINCSEYGTCPSTNPQVNNPENNPENKPENNPETKVTEYEYKKEIEGTWGNWSNWSNWSKVFVSKLDNRDVETKTQKETSTYTDEETIIDYQDLNKSCKAGYTLTADKTKCYKTVTDTRNLTCAKDANFVKQEGLNCIYIEEESVTLTCPNGYEQIGNNCKKTTSTLNEVDSINPICPQLDGYITTNRNGFDCTYTKHTRGQYVETTTGETIPKNDENYIYIEVGKPEYKLVCNGNDCSMQWVHIYAIYESVTEIANGKATCDSGYTKNGNMCTKYEVHTDTVEEKLVCPIKSGYDLTQNGTKCTYTKEVTERAICTSGYREENNKCVKTTTTFESYIKSCPVGYNLNQAGTKCEKEEIQTVVKTTTIDVTYYRYRTREYLNGTTDYKWSSSKNDKNLLNAGYKLTGKTR